MNDGSFASLSPTLLARKGGARPAMRPQHGGMLGSIGPASDLASPASSDECLDDLGWNDMGDEQPPLHNAEVIKLTPSPVNQDAAAEARHLDEQTDAKLAEFTVSSGPSSIGQARDQQEVLAKRIVTTSPPVLCDAIMPGTSLPVEDDWEDHSEEDDTGSETAVREFCDTNEIAANSGNSDDAATGLIPGKAAVIQRQVTALKTPRVVRPHRVAAVDQGKRAAFTLRLDADRHLKLRLASTIGGRSAQQIVTAALDAFLDDMPELATLAAQVKRPGTDPSKDNE